MDDTRKALSSKEPSASHLTQLMLAGLVLLPVVTRWHLSSCSEGATWRLRRWSGLDRKARSLHSPDWRMTVGVSAEPLFLRAYYAVAASTNYTDLVQHNQRDEQHHLNQGIVNHSGQDATRITITEMTEMATALNC